MAQGYETYRRVIIRSSRLARVYYALSSLCVAMALWRCVVGHAHMQISDVELIPPTIFSSNADFHECPPRLLASLRSHRAGAGSVRCQHWDAIEAIESARSHVFISTQHLDVQQRRCARGCGTPRQLWKLEAQTAGLVASPELFNLSFKHSFRTRTLPSASADCRQMGGALVRFKRDVDAEQHLSLILQHDASQYEVLHLYSPSSGRATHVPITSLLRSAGIELESRSDSMRRMADCKAWATNSSLRAAAGGACRHIGDTFRARGVSLEVHVVYSNLWSTSVSLWKPHTWLKPSEMPSFLMFARRLPGEEATRVKTISESRGGWRRRRVVRTTTGIKFEVLGSGGIGFITAHSVWRFLVDTLISLGIAYTATELVLSFVGYFDATLVQSLLTLLLGDLAQVRSALYFNARRMHED
ncbi:hypothetical protein AB1Y20_020360 [Prymnesium parvum]|uniref:Uncharacterized protein n=1 Tax=Prymnesium parvum TaxID=97485 RepID=A0AB34JZ23_PRYPA